MSSDTEMEVPVEEKATSTVEVVGTVTIRTYPDGAVQRNVWDSEERAIEYAESVREQEGE